jgi:ribosomal protein S18 acetylase RimI-like enzyme
VFLAYEGDLAIGLAICLVGFSSFRAQPLLNIHDIAVRPAARGRGVGRRLLAAIEQDARELGCCKVTLEVRADNHRAKAAYENAGFRAGQPETLFLTRWLE